MVSMDIKINFSELSLRKLNLIRSDFTKAFLFNKRKLSTKNTINTKMISCTYLTVFTAYLD